MNGIFANYLRTYVLKHIWPKGVSADKYFELLIQISKPIDIPYIHVYV